MPTPAERARIPSYIQDIVQRVGTDMRREPWLRIPPDARVDHLPGLLDSLLLDALAEREVREVPDGVRAAAREHGRHRREQRFPEEILFDEYSLLRNHTLRMLWTTHAPEEAERIIGRVDRCISEATVASLRAWHEAA